MTATKNSPWPDLIRPPTSYLPKSAANEDVDDRVKPGQGEFCGGEGRKTDICELQNLNRTAVGLTRPSKSFFLRHADLEDVDPGTSPGRGISWARSLGWSLIDLDVAPVSEPLD